MSASLWVDPGRTLPEEEFVKRYLMPDDVYIDVGANVGVLVLAASGRISAEGCIYAIEAHPRIFGFLKANIELNDRGNIVPFNVALSDKPGLVGFTSIRSDDQNRMVAGNGTLTIRATTLDELAIDLGQIALIKIDVEGAEKLVLDGALHTLDRTEAVFFEYGAVLSADYGHSFRDLYDVLTVKGFKVGRIAGDEVIEVSRDYISPVVTNYLGFRDAMQLTRRIGLQHRVGGAPT